METVEVQIFENGIQIDRVRRPLRSLEGRPAIKYRRALHPLVDGSHVYLDGRAPMHQPSAKPVTVCDAADGPIEDEAAPDDEIEWDDEQQAVIAANPAERLLVDAGPGTGKTAVACARVAELINRHDLSPSRIWLVSFTRTAVREIADRIASYLDDPGSAFAVKIATLDAHAWALHSGFDEEATLLGSYEENIERVLEMIQQNTAAQEHLEAVEHLVVDEAQDIVGVRAELVLEIIGRVSPHCGVTVFADEAQAIYGFATDEDDAPEGAREPTLPERIRQKLGSAVRCVELRKVHRTQSPQLLQIFTETRRMVLDGSRDSAAKLAGVTSDLWNLCHGQVPEVTKQDIADRDNVFVLFRRRSDVLLASSFLSQVPHRIRMSGMPVCLEPWLGAVFAEYVNPDIDRHTFENLWASRVAGTPVERISVEQAWDQIVRLAGRTESVADMRRLRKQLGRSRPPAELCTPELGDRGPVIGTIHASKGREADIVHVMLPGAPGEGVDLDEEARVIFVAATRGRKQLKVGRGYEKSATRIEPSGRVYRLLYKDGQARAQVEIGREGDVGAEGLAGRKFFTDASAVRESQGVIASLHGRITGASATCDRNAEFSYRVAIEDDQHCVAVLGLSLNRDLFRIGQVIQDRSGGPRRRPPDQIRHLRIVGVRTVALPPDAPEAERLHSPWNTTGIMLAPILLGYTAMYLPAMRG